MDAVSRALLMTGGASGPLPGQQAYTTPGTYTWVAPAGVTRVCVVCVGGGGGGFNGGGGGGLGWRNNITVTPGTSYTVSVGGGTTNVGGDSFFASSVTGRGASNENGGGFVGDGGGNGGSFAGGAGGYSGNGGNTGSGGSGGGGGGGRAGTFYTYGNVWETDGGGAGGGVEILGQGNNGGGASFNGGGGGGGSGGSSGGSGSSWFIVGRGGAYGGGGGATGYYYDLGTGEYYDVTGEGASGAVRIIWGAGRAFPSTNTGNL